MDINYIINLENKYQQFLNIHHKKNKPIILYGCGVAIEAMIKLLKKSDLIPEAISDTNMSKCAGNLNGIEIIPFDVVLKKYIDFYVIISAPSFEKEIRDYLLNYIKSEDVFIFDAAIGALRNMNVQEYKKYLQMNEQNLIGIYEKLEDDKSKVTMENIISGWVSYDLQFYKDIYSPIQYFPQDILKLSNDEVFLDIGSFTGDTLEQFIEETKDMYKEIYAFEPSKRAYDELCKIRNNKNQHKIRIINKGVYEETTRLYFNDNGSHEISDTSSIVDKESATCEIDVVDIDSVIDKEVTFIKMDIEGSELSALKGAERTIRRYKPKLAICIYHKNEDIIDIPKYIMGLGLEYKYYIRQHWNTTGTDTVFYAI